MPSIVALIAFVFAALVLGFLFSRVLAEAEARGHLLTQAKEHLLIVRGDTVYYNNHHVEGVGYYHAARGRWFEHPWNEFREAQGYYWYGDWHPEPAPPGTVRSIPEKGEASRVNALWCALDPERQDLYQQAVKRFGFGIAEGRREGR